MYYCDLSSFYESISNIGHCEAISYDLKIILSYYIYPKYAKITPVVVLRVFYRNINKKKHLGIF